MNNENEMCAYCAHWFLKETMKQITGDDNRNYYCEHCYPEVLAAVQRLPWNRQW